MNRVSIATLILALGAACNSETRSDTLIVLEVDSDLAVPGQLDAIDIQVAAASGAMVSRSFAVSARTLPVKLALVPEGDQEGAFTATVIARAGTKETLRQAVATRFVPNQARRLLVFLGTNCLTMAPMCTGGQTCRAGRCVSPSDVMLLPLADAGAPSDARPADTAAPVDGPVTPILDGSPPVDTPPAVDMVPPPDVPPGVDMPPPVDMAPPVDMTPPPPDMPPPPCGAAGQACCTTGARCQGILECTGNVCACTAPGLTCGGACVNRLTSAQHCGACNNSCEGGTCAMGVCQPVTIAPIQESPVNLAIDNTNLYFRRGSGASAMVVRLPKAGGAVVNLALAQDGQGTMLSDESRLYFYGNRQISACALPACAGGPQMLVATMPSTTLGVEIIHLAFNLPKSRLFWSDHTRIRSVATVGGVARNHFTNNMASPVATDINFLYYVAAPSVSNPNRTIHKLRIEDPPALDPITEFPAAEPAPRQFVMTPGRLFWQTAPAITALQVPDPATNAVPPPFFSGQVSSIFVEGNTLFFGSGNSVRSCPVTGCGAGPRTIATPSCAVRDVVADARAVYWICGNGELMKVAR